MAKFEISYEITAKYEGGYVNDPTDAGGETIFGVARNSWPKLSMWYILDDYKNTGLRGRLLENACKSNERFMKEVHDVYFNQYWKKIQGDKIADQKHANAIYDFAVNSGTNRAIRYAQLVLGIKSDGVMGNQSINTLNNSTGFLDAYIDARIRYFKSIVKARPANQKFLNGWLKRAEGLR